MVERRREYEGVRGVRGRRGRRGSEVDLKCRVLYMNFISGVIPPISGVISPNYGVIQPISHLILGE